MAATAITDHEARTKLIKARIAMIIAQPFFGTLALRLQLVEDATLDPPTMGVDGTHLFYHPKWVNDHSHDLVMAAVAHEVGHCIFEHIGRRQGRAAKRWNMAGDYVINAVLKDCGFTIGNDWLYSPGYAGMSSDQVYTMLPEVPEGDAFDKIADQGAPGADPDLNAQDWKLATVQAADMERKSGKLPGALKRFIDELVNGRTDWRAVLRRFVTEKAREDYSFQRLNRKMTALGIYLPGLYSEAMGEMVTCIDTSGSIDEKTLNEFGGEIGAIRDQMRPTMTRVIYCDARVNHVDEFETYDTLKLEPHGGGGTDFRPPFDWLEQRDIEPKCMCYLTDGYGPFPVKPPPYPVLWLMTTDVQPPWGEVVRIEV